MVNERQHASYGYTEGTYFSTEFDSYQSSPTGAITWSASSQSSGESLRDADRRTGAAMRRHALLVIDIPDARSEEHTSELQSLMHISYAVFRLKKYKQNFTLIISNQSN